MSKKRPSQKPTVKSLPPDCPITLLDFQRMFPDEAACLLYLQQMLWPDGFVCEECSKSGEPFRIAIRPRVLKCRSCQYEVSLRIRLPHNLGFFIKILVKNIGVLFQKVFNAKI